MKWWKRSVFFGNLSLVTSTNWKYLSFPGLEKFVFYIYALNSWFCTFNARKIKWKDIKICFLPHPLLLFSLNLMYIFNTWNIWISWYRIFIIYRGLCVLCWSTIIWQHVWNCMLYSENVGKGADKGRVQKKHHIWP